MAAFKIIWAWHETIGGIPSCGLRFDWWAGNETIYHTFTINSEQLFFFASENKFAIASSNFALHNYYSQSIGVAI